MRLHLVVELTPAAGRRQPRELVADRVARQLVDLVVDVDGTPYTVAVAGVGRTVRDATADERERAAAQLAGDDLLTIEQAAAELRELTGLAYPAGRTVRRLAGAAGELVTPSPGRAYVRRAALRRLFPRLYEPTG